VGAPKYECINGKGCIPYIPEIALGISKQIRKMAESNHIFLALADLGDTDAIVEYLQGLMQRGVLEAYVDPHCKQLIGIVGYSCSTLWWAKDDRNRILIEEIILSFNGTVGFGRVAVQRLEEIARENGCSIIMSGNFLGVGQQQIENLYVRKSGFTKLYSNFFKVSGKE